VTYTPEAEIEVRQDPAHHVEWTLNAASSTVIGFSVVLFGWAATETSGSATASVDVYDASDHVGVAVLPVRLASGESAEAWYGPNGVWFKNGVHHNVSPGQAKGSVFFRHYRR